MKYVILITDEKMNGLKRQWPFIFPDRLVHSKVAKSMIHLVGFDYDYMPEVFSAGHCSIGTKGFYCQHGSESLKLGPHPAFNDRDSELLNQPACLQGMMTTLS